jgi:Fe-S-cluster containining protein
MNGTFILSHEPPKDAHSIALYSLDTASGRLEFHIGTRGGKARISDLVHIARTITDEVCHAVRDELSQAGNAVPCHRGCWACCRYLVPLSVPEAVQLTEDIVAMPPAGRREVLTSFVETAKTLISAAPAHDGSPSDVSQWYSQLKLDCPLLKDGVCTMYEHRPLTCREHMVTGSSRGCYGSGQASAGEMPVSGTRSLAEVTAELEGTTEEAMMLPFAPAWYEGNVLVATRTWPAPLLAEQFVRALSHQTVTHAAAL